MSSHGDLVDPGTPVLRRLLRGGFKLPHDDSRGLVILIRGRPGTGKSTLALQVLDNIKPKAPKVPRYYCTLEQSEADLKFKLATMITARAIDIARRPDFKTSQFICSWPLFWGYLKNRLKSGIQSKFESVAYPELQNVVLRLFDEPESGQPESNKKTQEVLADLVAQYLHPERIQIFTNSPNPRTESPIKAFRNHVVLASSMVQGAFVENGGKSKQRSSRPLAVVDGLSLLSVSEREALELQQIVERLRRYSQVGILVYEPNESESTCLDHHVDMVIELSRRHIETPLDYLIHEFCIRKSRYQEAALGQHQFKIRGSGIALFPSLHFQVHHHNYMELELNRSSHKGWRPTTEARSVPKSCKSGSLIDIIFSPQPGESTVLLGSRNSFKTQLCLDFLTCGHWGCPKKATERDVEKGLLISLIDNAPDIQHGLGCPWKNAMSSDAEEKCQSCDKLTVKHARPFCQRPGCITPSEFFHYMKELIDRRSGRPGRLVFWDLTQMDYRFPLFKEDKMLLPAMMDLFKTKKLRSLLMGAGNAENTGAASAMADHVLFCWRSAYVPQQEGKWVSSLMLYVDRTTASTKQSGKVLYCIPVDADDKLKVPRTRGELTKGGYKLDSNNEELSPEDKDQIKSITQMQGVA